MKRKLSLLGILLVVAIAFGCLAGITAFADGASTEAPADTVTVVRPAKTGMAYEYGIWQGTEIANGFSVTAADANGADAMANVDTLTYKIGRASCRERV